MIVSQREQYLQVLPSVIRPNAPTEMSSGNLRANVGLSHPGQRLRRELACGLSRKV